MMRVIILLTSLLIVETTFGQNTPKTILWEVIKKGNAHISYLFGTFHDVSPSFFNSLTNTRAKLNHSDVLFVEEQENKELISKGLENYSNWNFMKWKIALTNRQDSIFKLFVKRTEDSIYYKLSPLILTLTTGRLYMLNFCETDTSFSELMDHYIEELAIKQKKKVFSLDKNQADILNRTANNSNSVQDSIYISYSIRYMQNMLDNDLTDCNIMSLYKRFEINYDFSVDLTKNSNASPLLLKRNNQWVNVLKETLLKKNCFVAVGFTHLFFKQGLIQQLRKLGFLVTPIPV